MKAALIASAGLCSTASQERYAGDRTKGIDCMNVHRSKA
jgi:hypothetical protein